MKIKKARRLAVKYGLSAPDWALNLNIPIKIIKDRIGSDGGCGPGIAGDWLVPDTVYGLNMKPACYCHDCDYSEVETIEDQVEADKRLYDNGMIIIRLKSMNRLMVWLRKRRWKKYYFAVKLGGGSFTSGND